MQDNYLDINTLDDHGLADIVEMRLRDEKIDSMPLTYRHGGREEPNEYLERSVERSGLQLKARMQDILLKNVGDIEGKLDYWCQSDSQVTPLTNMLDMVQMYGDRRFYQPLLQIVQNKSLIEYGKPDGHAGILKALIACDYKGDETFWMDNYRTLGSQYGALIFAGLCQVGLDTAMNHLNELISDKQASSFIMLFLPAAAEMFGKDAVVKELKERKKSLPRQFIRDASSFLEAKI